MPTLHPIPLAFALLLGGSLAPIASASAAMGSTAVDFALIERYRSDRNWLAALAQIERGLATTPNDPSLYRLRVLTLADIGTNHRAWTLYRQRPELFDADERARLEAAELARRITWSRLYVADEATRLVEAEAAATGIAAFRANAASAGLTVPANTRYDELIVLNRLGRHREVADEYARLQAQGPPVPGYALGAVGDSLLALRRPDEAAPVLERAIAADPDNHNLPLQLAYAQLERERFDLALPLLAGLVQAQPAWPRALGATRGYENWYRYDAETNHALARAFGEDLAGAQAMMEPLAKVGPNNADLQATLGSVYMFRGWPTRALERFRIASTLDERNVAARIGQVETLSTLALIDQARPQRDELLLRFPNEPRVQAMDRQWRARQGASARVYAGRGRNQDNAGASPLGNRDSRYGVELQGPLWSDRWRLLAVSDHRSADFQGARVAAHRNDVGIGYAYDRFDARLLAGRASDGLGGTGVGLDLGWRISDLWSARGALHRNDAEASLQARASGISADSASVALDYHRNESTEFSASAQQWRYDDGNRRDTLQVAAAQRWVSQPHWLLSGLASAGASRASRNDAPYFNPSRDGSLDIGLRGDHLGWRRYDRHFRQRMTVTIGPYWQQGFGTAWIPAARYEHEWQFAPGRVLLYGLSWSRPVYDGQRESRIGLDAELRWGE